MNFCIAHPKRPINHLVNYHCTTSDLNITVNFPQSSVKVTVVCICVRWAECTLCVCGGWDGVDQECVCVCVCLTWSIWPLRLSSGAPGVSVAWNPVCMFVCHLASERHNPPLVRVFVNATALAIDQTGLFYQLKRI